jgi:hypothetical protein
MRRKSEIFLLATQQIADTCRTIFPSQARPLSPVLCYTLKWAGAGFIKSWTVSVDNKPVGTFTNGWSKAFEELGRLRNLIAEADLFEKVR